MARRFAVRVRDGDAVTAPLTLTLGRVNVPESLAGYPTVILDVLLKGVYQGLDDPLLTVEAGAIDPGRSVRVAETLGLSMAYSDTQAEAMLRSMFGVSLTEASTSGRGTAPSTHSALPEVVCDGSASADLCDAYDRLATVCVGDALNSSTVSEANSQFRRCVQIVINEIVPAWLDHGDRIRSFSNFLRLGSVRLAERLALGAAKTAAQKLFDRIAALRQFIGLGKTQRASEEPSQRSLYEAMRAASQSLTDGNPDLIAEAERDAAADGVDDDEREAWFDLVDEADYHQSDAAALASGELEDVYTGEADVVETLGTAAVGGAATCRTGYDEFPIDDRTSTCVWGRLVEPSCYAGSRQVSTPDLGGANACLYYSLDFFQPDGSCRENYARVHFQGRETCRWAELGADLPAWYTLEKEHGVASTQAPEVSPTAATIRLTWGADPSDLDSHLWGPTEDGDTFHVFYGNPSIRSRDATFQLGWDDTTSFGPEVLTISSFPIEGTYQYGVHRFDGTGSILDSPARVELNLGGEVTIFSPAAASGAVTDTWAVFNIEVGSDLSLRIVEVQRFVDGLTSSLGGAMPFGAK